MSKFSSLKQLEEHLSTRSYIDGYEPSQADVGVFTVVKSAPDAKEYPHVARWYSHIATWTADHANLRGDAMSAPLLSLEEAKEPAAAQAAAAGADEDDDEVDLFGSDDDEDDAEAERVKNERVAAYQAKRADKAAANAAAGKDAPVAKSVVTMQVKPWDDETDMEELEKNVRAIEKDGLVWGLSKLVPIGYGIRMLQVNLVIEDEKIGLDDLQEEIAELEEWVQSTDIAAMQKL